MSKVQRHQKGKLFAKGAGVAQWSEPIRSKSGTSEVFFSFLHDGDPYGDPIVKLSWCLRHVYSGRIQSCEKLNYQKSELRLILLNC